MPSGARQTAEGSPKGEGGSPSQSEIHPISRRRFLGQANCALVSSIPILNTLLNLRLVGDVSAAAGTPTGYKALVCIFLNGGNDSFNMLPPRGAAYAEYAAIRANLAIPENQLLTINPLNDAGRPLGLHPGVLELQQLFENGHAAFIVNVGTLIEPVTKAQYTAGTGNFPLGLFSHSDQIEQWQTSIPHNRSGIGWGGRMADLLKGLNAQEKVSMNISLTGSNVFQAGDTVSEYAITDTGAVALNGYKSTWQANDQIPQLRSAAIDSQMALEYQNIFQQAYNVKRKDAVRAYEIFSAATANALPVAIGSTFPATPLGRQLRMVAQTIAGRQALAVCRQTFFMNFGGWDHHSDVVLNQAAMLPIVSQAVGAFYNALVSLGMENDVTLFLASDFGRTLTSNGKGSDHAWGGNVFAVGGAVKGRRIYGQYPDLYADNPLEVGRGRLIPTTAVDLYFAEMALWMDVPKSSLALVLPNIGHFYNTAGASPPLGFLL
jgi:uncharacterized protein (DUF1501 family)